MTVQQDTLARKLTAAEKAVIRQERRILLRAVLLLNTLLAGLAILGVAFATRGAVSVAQLVTLFLVTSTFVGVVGGTTRPPSTATPAPRPKPANTSPG